MLKNAMLISKSPLGSALAGKSMIRPTGHGRRGFATAGLMLTSLVDAFSILVIFLIMNNANTPDVVNFDKLTLPTAAESQTIEQGITVRIEGSKFFVEDQPVGVSQLAATLKKFNDGADAAKKEGLIIVADRDLDYEGLSPVILAGSHAGFTKYKFAVVRK